MYVGGSWVESESGGRMEATSPAMETFTELKTVVVNLG
jgi:hypothetical protein